MDENFREKFSSGNLTSKKTLSVMAFMVLALGISAPAAIAQDTGGTESVSLGQNGVSINLGQLEMNGTDIVSSGTTIWDASAGEVPSDVVGINLSNSAGDFLSWDSTAEALNVDAGSIQSGTTASDVGLGNVRNIDIANTGGENINYDSSFNEFNLATQIEGIDYIAGNDNYTSVYFSDTEGNVGTSVRSSGEVEFIADSGGLSGGPFECYIDGGNGSFNCEGTKNWIHDLNETSNSFYSAQESPQVRAVYEGQVNVTDGQVNVSLPYHFSGTVSDERPSLRVQATPHSLDNVAVTERTDDYLIIKADTQDTVKVDYRVTGIREGYEDKQVVRPKE